MKQWVSVQTKWSCVQTSERNSARRQPNLPKGKAQIAASFTGARDLVSCHRDRNNHVSVQHHLEMGFF